MSAVEDFFTEEFDWEIMTVAVSGSSPSAQTFCLQTSLVVAEAFGIHAEVMGAFILCCALATIRDHGKRNCQRANRTCLSLQNTVINSVDTMSNLRVSSDMKLKRVQTTLELCRERLQIRG